MRRQFVPLYRLAVLLAVIMTAPAVQAEPFPNRPVKLVIGFSPGGTTDQVARILQRRMEEVLGRPIVIEYRTGAGGNLAAAYVARAEPSGHTVFLASYGHLATNVSLYKDPGYDPVRDFAPVSKLGHQANVLVVHPSLQVRTLGDLVAMVRSHPGKFSYGSAGIGTSSHLAVEFLKARAGIDIAHVPYRGSAPAIQNVMAGQVQMAFSLPAPLLPHVKAGMLRPIVAMASKRAAVLPDVPTLEESGFPGFGARVWHGLVAPAGTPPAAIAVLHKAFTTAILDEQASQQLAALGIEVETSTPEAFAAFAREQIAQWAVLVAAAGLKAQ